MTVTDINEARRGKGQSETDPVSELAPDQIAAMMDRLGRDARAAAVHLAGRDGKAVESALLCAAASMRANVDLILAANEKDMAGAKARGLSGAMLDRLLLDDARIEGIARAVEAVVALENPVGQVTDHRLQQRGELQKQAQRAGLRGIERHDADELRQQRGQKCRIRVMDAVPGADGQHIGGVKSLVDGRSSLRRWHILGRRLFSGIGGGLLHGDILVSAMNGRMGDGPKVGQEPRIGGVYRSFARLSA